ncbi:MAG: hypothetical protein ACTSRG_25415 [Candidatus Helarchaeota archaeon]
MKEIEIEGIKEAGELSKKCKSEEGRISPKVGVIIIKNEEIIIKSYRGEQESGEHAKFIALCKKGRDLDLKGATLITTLEPCTTRTITKEPCVQHIVDKGITKVIFGMTDPNPDIRGLGEILLRDKHGIKIDHFPGEFLDLVLDINKEFRQEQLRKYKSVLMVAKVPMIEEPNEGGIKIDIYNKKFVEEWKNGQVENMSQERVAITIFILPTALCEESLPISSREFYEITLLNWSDDYLGPIFSNPKIRHNNFIMSTETELEEEERFEVKEFGQIGLKIAINKHEDIIYSYSNIKGEKFTTISETTINRILRGLLHIVNPIYKRYKISEFKLSLIISNVKGCYLGYEDLGRVQSYSASRDAGPQDENFITVEETVKISEIQTSFTELIKKILYGIGRAFGIMDWQ